MQFENSPAAPPLTARPRTSQFGAVYFEALADLLWDPTSPHGCEASVAIRYLAKLQRLHERSVCTRGRRLFARAANRLHGVRSHSEGAVTTRCLVILLILAYVLLVIVATYIVTTPQPPMPPAPSYLPSGAVEPTNVPSSANGVQP